MDFEPHRAELTAYCYRMLGSFHEAEDLVQETFLRAWRAQHRYDPARASVRTWLYRIATNACLTALRGRARRPLPSGLGGPSTDPGAALTPAVDVAWLEPFPDARFDLDVRADLRLAWIAAAQILPARQRAVLVLRDVLQFSAAEVAEQLRTTVAAVNSALQRARATVANASGSGSGSETGSASESEARSGSGSAFASQSEHVREPADPEARAVAERYARAFEAADVPALVRLLADDAVLEMPPVPLWYRGADDYGRFMDRVFALRGTGWTVRGLSANGQPALAAYAPATGGGLLPHSLQVLTVSGGLVGRNVVFADPRVLDAFGMGRPSAEDLRSRAR